MVTVVLLLALTTTVEFDGSGEDVTDGISVGANDGADVEFATTPGCPCVVASVEFDSAVPVVFDPVPTSMIEYIWLYSHTPLFTVNSNPLFHCTF